MTQAHRDRLSDALAEIERLAQELAAPGDAAIAASAAKQLARFVASIPAPDRVQVQGWAPRGWASDR